MLSGGGTDPSGLSLCLGGKHPSGEHGGDGTKREGGLGEKKE